MTDKPSCETCTIQTCRMHPTNKPELKQEGVYFIQDAFRQFGCLSHPQAREYLMEPVLKELETIDRLVPYPQCPNLITQESQAYISAENCIKIHEVIAIIKNGVGGK